MPQSNPLVIVDTTATTKDVLLEGTPWIQLLSLAARGDVSLVVPEVVLRETARHWSQELADTAAPITPALEKLADRVAKLRRLGATFELVVPRPPQVESPDQDWFLARTTGRLQALGVHVPKVPTGLSVEDLLQRDLAVRKPFSTTGKGFRDALIWGTLIEALELTSANGPSFFVTNNLDDYCDGSGQLHPDLLAELPPSRSLVIVRSLTELLQTSEMAPLIAALVPSSETLRAFIASVIAGMPDVGEPSDDELVTQAVLSAVERLTNIEVGTPMSDADGADTSGLGLPDILENAFIASIEPDETVDWQAYATYEETTLLIHATVGVEMEIEGQVYRSDAFVEIDDLVVHGFDPDEHYADATLTVRAVVSFQVRLEAGVGVDEVELEGFEPT